MSEDASPSGVGGGAHDEGEEHEYESDDDFEDNVEHSPAEDGGERREEDGEERSVGATGTGPREAPAEGDALDGVVYEGSWHRGKPHGYGVGEFPDGTRCAWDAPPGPLPCSRSAPFNPPAPDEGYWVDGKRLTEEGETSRCVFPTGERLAPR